MPVITAESQIKSATIGIVVTRADGRVEDYGTVSCFHANPVLSALKNVFLRARTADLVRRFGASNH